MKSFLIILIAAIILWQVSFAGEATHEIGFGSYILTENENFKTDFGFNLHFDICPNNYLVLRTAISGLISKAGIGTQDTYSNAFFLNRGTLSEKPVLKDKFLIISLEKSILYRISKGTFEPYAGIGIGIYSTKLAGEYSYFNESSEYSFGVNLCGGLKYPMTSKWSSYLEIKQIISSFKVDNNNNRYPNISVESGLDIQDSKSIGLKMNRLVINAGLTFRL